MSRQKGTPNKNKEKLNTVSGELVITVDKNNPVCEQDDFYVVCEGRNTEVLGFDVEAAKDSGYRCVGGIAIHDIRNPVTNEYEPHYYQAMEKVDN